MLREVVGEDRRLCNDRAKEEDGENHVVARESVERAYPFCRVSSKVTTTHARARTQIHNI